MADDAGGATPGVDGTEGSRVVPRVARQEVHDAAPALGWYTDHVLYHEVWNRPAVDKRTRSLITVAALVAAGHPAQLRSHLRRARQNGVAPSELLEVLNQCAFYSGWPRVMTALPVLTETLGPAEMADAATGQRPATCRDDGDAVSTDLSRDREAPATFGMVVDAYADAVVEQDLWRRGELRPPDRALVTLAALLAVGRLDELVPVVRRGLQAGLSKGEVAEALGHLAFYVGLPAAEATGRVLDRALG
jgi:4-carboxymuconolactone decarboxylase